jgi:hypothetical protein
MDHKRAILYFQRALKLNPQYLSAWTLMGHEYVELMNTVGLVNHLSMLHNFSLYWFSERSN